MQLYSQVDPAYNTWKIGKSNVTVGSHGCFICSMATLYQRHPKEILEVPRAFTKRGDMDSAVVATYCGGKALGRKTKPPKGWCIAVTHFYRKIGYPTHFFCVNVEKGLMIDPLVYPARIQPVGYPIAEYRVFSETKLDTSELEAAEYQKKLAQAENALKFAKPSRFSMLMRKIGRLRDLILGLTGTME